MKKLRIFAASPSDMATERAKIETVAGMLRPLADNLGIVLEVIDWRAVVPDLGRPQQVIFDQLKPTSWDVFIGVLWHRFGTPPGGKDPQTQKEYLAGTEEEFKTALRLWQQYKKPHIMMYRCTRPIPPDALDPDQFKRVKEFFAQFNTFEGAHPGLYQSFDTTEAFEKLLLDNLQRLLLEHGEPVAAEVVQELAPKVPDNLPRRASFFGRDKEMSTALRAVSPDDRSWGVLVDGIGGIGKTALAVEAAYRCKEKGWFDAFIFVSAKQNALVLGDIRDLKPAARTLDEFLNETARVLGQAGIPRLAGDDKRRALLDALRSTHALLIYDNLEMLTKVEQEALADFLRDLPPDCKAIITSRRRGGEGAVWLRLEKLEWDAAYKIIEEEGKKDSGLAQKLKHAGEARWQELYDETKGSPLALVNTLGLMRVRTTLTFDGALDMLRGNRSLDLEKFIFQEARKELTTNDQAALRALSFFVPSANFEAWMEVAELSRNALETTIDRLSALSLVDVLTGEERYALHPLTRNFVRDELLADARISHDVGMRYADYWVGYAQRYGGRSVNYKTFHLIETEWSNLDAAAGWLWQTAAVQGENVGDSDAAQSLNNLAQFLCGAGGSLFFIGRWDDLVQLSAQSYEAMLALNDWSNAGWVAYRVTWVYYNRANIDEAERWVSRCVEAWIRAGDKYEHAFGMRISGLLAKERKDYDAAKRLYQDALTIFRGLKSDVNVAIVLNSLGTLEYDDKHYDAAETYYGEALVLYNKTESNEGLAVTYGNLGVLAFDRERWAEAQQWYEKGLPLAREIGRQDEIARILYGLAYTHDKQERPNLALPLAQESLTIYERLQHHRSGDARNMVERLMAKLGSH